jgi:hypothetical protein
MRRNEKPSSGSKKRRHSHVDHHHVHPPNPCPALADSSLWPRNLSNAFTPGAADAADWLTPDRSCGRRLNERKMAMSIFKLVLLAILRIAFAASLKIALLVYILFLPGAAPETKRESRATVLRRYPGQFRRKLSTT